jgi:hypothetical protein
LTPLKWSEIMTKIKTLYGVNSFYSRLREQESVRRSQGEKVRLDSKSILASYEYEEIKPNPTKED